MAGLFFLEEERRLDVERRVGGGLFGGELLRGVVAGGLVCDVDLGLDDDLPGAWFFLELRRLVEGLLGEGERGRDFVLHLVGRLFFDGDRLLEAGLRFALDLRRDVDVLWGLAA